MFDHFGISSADVVEKSKAFYEKALLPFGYKAMMGETGVYWGFGDGQKASFWIGKSESGESPSKGAHIAFSSPDRATVDKFYEVAIAAGGKDNGKPGVREMYHKDYYGAFVLDPDGNNVEAVCHKPE